MNIRYWILHCINNFIQEPMNPLQSLAGSFALAFVRGETSRRLWADQEALEVDLELRALGFRVASISGCGFWLKTA